MPKQVGQGRINERKKKQSFRFVPTRGIRDNSKKNCKKIQKIKIPHYGFFSSQKRVEKDEKERK